MIKLFIKLLTQNFEISMYKKIIEEQQKLIEEQQKLIEEQEKLISDLEESLNAKSIDGAKPNFIGWVAYDFHKLETRPKAYGKYFVCRKDGKVHWETWNGSGWAYNENAITHWKEVEPPSR